MSQLIAEPSVLKELEVFAGTWTITGENYPSDNSQPNAPVHGNDVYEWLPGNHFLVNNWKHLTDDGGHIGISILGYDSEKEEFYTLNFDNLGFDRKYVLKSEGKSWNFVGDKERASRKFSDDGSTYTEFWEVLSDTKQWIPLCRMEGTRK